MSNLYRILISKETNALLSLPTKLKESNIQYIAYGTQSHEPTIHTHDKDKNIIFMSKGLAQALRFPPHDSTLHLYIHEETCFLGPLLGVFTSGFTPYPLRPIGERTVFFSKLLTLEKKVGAHVFLFGEEHINWEQGTINGLFYNHGWQVAEVPFPNVIYDRLPNRRSEKKAIAAKIQERFKKEYLIPWYNPGFFNKLDIFESLQHDEASIQYLPETHLFTSSTLLDIMLKKHGHVYIKPIKGSLGRGIHHIIYDKDLNEYYCRFRDKEGANKLHKYPSIDTLCHHLFKKRKLEHFLVQQGITSISFKKRMVDFRVHTNKNEDGLWQVTAVAAKIARQGHITGHINNGGSIKTIDEMFETNEEREKVYLALKETALTLSSALERHLDGIIGEIGFDLGIDHTGKVWLFEANSKPGRTIFKHPQLKNYDMLTRKLSLAYSIYLTEKSIMQPVGDDE